MSKNQLPKKTPSSQHSGEKHPRTINKLRKKKPKYSNKKRLLWIATPVLVLIVVVCSVFFFSNEQEQGELTADTNLPTERLDIETSQKKYDVTYLKEDNVTDVLIENKKTYDKLATDSDESEYLLFVYAKACKENCYKAIEVLKEYEKKYPDVPIYKFDTSELHPYIYIAVSNYRFNKNTANFIYVKNGTITDYAYWDFEDKALNQSQSLLDILPSPENNSYEKIKKWNKKSNKEKIKEMYLEDFPDATDEEIEQMLKMYGET